LCALAGCETAYYAAPTTPSQPETEIEMIEVDPRLETIETVQFATPPGVAPVQQSVPKRQPPPPPPVHIDDCPACGMG
jgi:hypothetical protein